MSSKKQDLALIGAGATACAVCCAGPILGFLAAIGLGTVLGVAVFGTIGLAISAVAIVVMLRRRRLNACTTTVADQPVNLVRRH
jgi:Kef-type K+ transport system membrane component KefB